MNNIAALAPDETLPSLIDKATAALDSARSSAEVLEARDMARAAYDAAKTVGRMARVKQAHDSLIADVHRAQANALAIRARAEIRLAEEYDAAQPEDARKGGYHGNQWAVAPDNAPLTAADIGLRRDEILTARRLRDAEAADPGVVERTVSEMVERGEEPTRAALNREITRKPRQRQMDGRALWLWGRLKDFERDGIMAAGAAHLVSELTDPMREDVRRLAPLVREFLQQIEEEA